MWYNKGVDLLTVGVTARESEGGPYTLVQITGEADVTNSADLRRQLDEEVSRRPRTLINRAGSSAGKSRKRLSTSCESEQAWSA